MGGGLWPSPIPAAPQLFLKPSTSSYLWRIWLPSQVHEGSGQEKGNKRPYGRQKILRKNSFAPSLLSLVGKYSRQGQK